MPPSGPSVQYVTSTAYDALNRPTGVSWTPAAAAAAATGSGVTFNHTYNKANQRIGQTVTDNSWLNYPAATPTVNYTANALNQYTAVGAVTPTYDGNTNGNGNLTFDGTFTFGYDAENRLTSAVGAGNTASYSYDAQGRRKTRAVNGTTTVFVTDAGNREVLEYDGSSGALQRWYAYGLGSNDVLNQMNVAANTRATFLPDVQGSVIASIDSSSGTLSKIAYLPYGKSAGATAPFGYTAQRIDPETNGLYYYRARHYSPAWGRFMQSDPIGYSGGINLYAYVNNDPLNFTDPNGLVKDAAVTAVSQSAAPELAESQAVTDFVQQHPQAAMIEGGIGIVATVGAPLAVAAAGLIGAGVAAESAVGGSGALVPMAEAAFNTGTIRTIAGYQVAGNAGLVGNTYNINIWGLYATVERQGLSALANAFRSEASAAGASNISITGNAIINPGIANMNPAIAARYGFSFSQVNSTTILLQGLVP